MNDILDAKIEHTVNRVFSTIVENNKQDNSIVIALNLKRNQKDDLQRFIDKLDKFQWKAGESLKSIDVIAIKKQDVRDIALEIYAMEDQLRNNYSIDNQG